MLHRNSKYQYDGKTVAWRGDNFETIGVRTQGVLCVQLRDVWKIVPKYA